MDPAPGYDDHMPHDLVHFFVERHWRFRNGIYRQLASGGDARTFRQPNVRSRRQARRTAGKNRLSGQDVGASERLASLTHLTWELRAGRGVQAPDNLGFLRTEAGLDEDALNRAAAELDTLAERWHALPVGGELRLEWPWPERRTGRRRVRTS